MNTEKGNKEEEKKRLEMALKQTTNPKLKASIEEKLKYLSTDQPINK